MSLFEIFTRYGLPRVLLFLFLTLLFAALYLLRLVLRVLAWLLTVVMRGIDHVAFGSLAARTSVVTA